MGCDAQLAIGRIFAEECLGLCLGEIFAGNFLQGMFEGSCPDTCLDYKSLLIVVMIWARQKLTHMHIQSDRQLLTGYVIS